MRMDQAWVYKRHYLLHLSDFSGAQCFTAQLLIGSATLVLDSVRVSVLFCFGGFGSNIQLQFGR